MRTIIFHLLIALLSFQGFSQTGYQVGDKAEDFKLMNIDGKELSMSDFKDAKGFIVIFTCNHCPYSVLYEDRIISLDKKYKEKGYPVIAINPNDPEIVPEDSFEYMKKRASEKGFTFPYLLDEGQTIFPKYGAVRTPHVFILKKEGKDIIVKYIGAIDDHAKNENEVTQHYVKDVIEALLENREPRVSFTKAIGCSIKKK